MKNKLLALCCMLPCAVFAQSSMTASEMNIDDSNPFEDNFQAQYEIESKFDQNALASLSDYQGEETSQPSQTDTAIGAESENCLPYDNIKINGVTLIDKTQFTVPSCITQHSLNQLSRQITKAYINAGFLQSTLQFAKQGKTLILNVTERKIREITGGSRTVNVNTLFPNHKNRPLDIRYLEQGIERGNVLSGNKLTMDVYPHDDGTATIALDNQASKPWSASVGVDNYGSQQNRARLTANASIDSPLGLSDSLFLGAYSNITSKDKAYNRGINAFYRVPYGAASFDVYGGVSKSKKMVDLQTGSYPYRTQSENIGVKAERVMSRGQSHITSVYGGIDYSRKKATLADSTPLAVQSPTLTGVQLGVKHLQKFKKTTWVNNLSLEKGVEAFGAKKEKMPLTPEYFILRLRSNLNHQFANTKSWVIHSQHALSLQYSDDELYSGKSFDLINRYGVRGFDEFSLNGKKGILSHNNLLARHYINSLMYVEPYLGLDAGVVANNSGSYRAAGVALGVNVGNSKYWDVNIEASHGVAESSNNKTVKEQQVSASMHWNF